MILFGKLLEIKAKGRTSESITKLMDLAPKTALVVRDGQEIEVPVGEVVIDDIIIVRPGESIPVEKNIGDKVIAATINKTGFFKFKAQKVGDDTTLAQIISASRRCKFI